MTTDQIILFSIFGAIMALLIHGRLRHDLIAFAGLMAGVLSGVVPAGQAFSGFGHPATMVVALVLVATAGLMRTGAVGMISRHVARADRPMALHIAIIGGFGAFLSAFMNNIAALAILMPIDMATARKARRAAALTLMPLAFATILGGMTTMIGTPPNLLVSTFREEALGEPFRMFDFLPVGGLVALAGILFIALIGWRLIPRRDLKNRVEDGEAQVRGYVAELVVTEQSRLLGQRLAEADIEAEKADAAILAIKRAGKRVYQPGRQAEILLGDILLVEAAPAALEEFRTEVKLAFPDGSQADAPQVAGDGQALIEVVVTENSRIVGKTAVQVRLARLQGAVLMGIIRKGRTIRDNLRRTPVQAGDILLLLVPEDRQETVTDWLGALPLDGPEMIITRESRALLAIGLFAAGIAAASFGLVTMPIALGLVVIGYVLGRVLSINEIYDHVDWPIIVLLGAMIPLGLALDSTGGSALIAQGLAWITSGQPGWVSLLLLMIATMTMSDILNNNATTILAAPVGVRLAENIGASPDPFLIGVAVAASCAFLTPIGHQNNTLILGPGGYRFGDYWRMGLPIEIIVLAVSIPAILVFWPL